MDDLSTHYKSVCDAAFEYTLTNPTQQQDTTKGTLFGTYNGVTGYFQNVPSYKDDEAKLKSILYGGTAQIKTQRAFNLCADFATAGPDAFLLN